MTPSLPKSFLGTLPLAVLSFASAMAVEPAHVTIGPHQGSTAFFIDGKPEVPLLIFQTVLTEKEPTALRRAGYRLFSFNGNMTAFGMSLGWIGEGQYDYRECDAALKAFAKSVPDGYCIPRVLVSAPDWWLEAYPDEAVRFANSVGWQPNEWGGTKHESFASQRWRREAGEALRRFIGHILASPYRERVAGLHIAGGIYGEWHQWSVPDLPDTSEPMRQAWQRYLEGKYHDDVEALRTAWHDPDATFEAVHIPTAEEQHETHVGMFRDPLCGRRIVDYYECLHHENLDAIEHFCRIVKRETENRWLTMALYGYTPDLSWPQVGDHRDGPRALRSDVIDILASPHSYGRRRLGQDALFRHFPAAVVLHGKLFLDEADDRTYLAPEGWPARYAPDFEASVQMLRRQFANAVSRGVGLYYMDQSGTFFADPLLIAELGRLKRWGDYSMTLPRTSVAQVAVVSSLQSEFYTAGRETGQNHISQALYDAQIAELCRSGAPFDWIHIDDLADERLRSYRVYVFLDGFYLTRSQQAAIEKLKTGGRTLLWFYAPGFVGTDGLSLDRMQAVTGLQFQQQPEGTLQVTFDRNAFPHAPAAFGFPVSQSPVFVPTDADLRIWGRTASGTPAFVGRDAGIWQSVYCLTPVLPSAVLRRVFRDAGVHIYCDSDDPFSANASWVCIHAATPGRKTIRLPAPAPVFDAVREKLVAASDTEFAVDLDAGETGIWVLARPGP